MIIVTQGKKKRRNMTNARARVKDQLKTKDN